MIEEKTIIENAELFTKAITHYRLLGEELITKLAKKLNYPIEEISENWRRELEYSLTSGHLNNNWNYRFHGIECKFINMLTGQVVDVKLRDFKDKYALPDPYFFAKYVHTTSEEATLANLLKDKFQDTNRAFEILLSKGLL